MLTTASITPISISSIGSTNIKTNDIDAQLQNIQQQIQLLDLAIGPLKTSTKKKLSKVEKEIKNSNFLIDSGLGSKRDQAALRNTKRQLRQRRIRLWEELKPLPDMEARRAELFQLLVGLQRQHGVLYDDIL